MKGFSADRAAALLTAHFATRTRGEPDTSGPASRADCYSVQDLILSELGGACGWKVGRSKTDPEPYCAPIPLTRRLASGGDYVRPDSIALVEAELGFRIGGDVPASTDVWDRTRCAQIVDA
ncbi:hypothetical protein AB4144_16720, partial [Rhizobiaceae sp. 2RAB30]